MRIPSGTTDQVIYFVAVDATDLKTRETGLTSFTVYRDRNGAGAAVFTTPTVTEVDATNMPGLYKLLLDEDMTIGAGNDSEEMAFHITHAGMAPVTRVIELYRRTVTSGHTLGVESDGDLTKVNALDGHTAQTGDAYARLGAPAGASIAADLVVIDNFVDGIESALTAGVPVASIAANAITATAIQDGAITDAKVADDVAVTLRNGAHGGSSAVLTLNNVVISNASGAGISVAGTVGIAASGTVAGLNITSTGAAAVTISDTQPGAYGIYASGGSGGAGLMASLAANTITATAIQDGAITNDKVADDVAVALRNGAHGGGSAVLTLKNVVINNPAGTGVDIAGSTTGLVATGATYGAAFVGDTGLRVVGPTHDIDADIYGSISSIAAGAIVAASFGADVDAEILSYLVDDATRIDASSLNTAAVTSIPAILDDTGTAGVAVAAASKTGYALAATGLDAITATEPTGKPTTFPGWIMWMIQHLRCASKTPTSKSVKTEAGVEITRQTITDDEEGTETLGPIIDPEEYEEIPL